MSNRKIWIALVVALILLAGCVGTMPTTPPGPTYVIVPRDSETPESTATPTLTATPTPTVTSPFSPTPSLTPVLAITSTPIQNGRISEGHGGLRLRADPGENSQVIRTLDELTLLNVIGRTADSTWLQVISPEGDSGWVMATHVTLIVDVNTLAINAAGQPVAEAPSVPGPASGAQVAAGRGGLRLRASPDDDSAVVANLEESSPLSIIGRTADNAWLRVTAPDNLSGWVWGSYVDTTIDLNVIPIMVDGGGSPPATAVVAAPTSVPPTSAPTSGPVAIASTIAPSIVSTVLPTSISPTPIPPTTAPSVPTTAPPTAAPAVAAIPENANARVAAERWGLRVRAEPDESGSVVTSLDALTPLVVIGRTTDGSWLQVTSPDGLTGWVFSQYIEVGLDLNAVEVAAAPVEQHPVIGPPSGDNAPQIVAPPADDNSQVVAPAVPPPSVAINNPVSGITGHARQIYLNGQSLGNRANVFSKVGDSITVGTYFLYSFGWGTYNLQGYSYLSPALGYFSAAIARDGASSFANISLAADNGWTTRSILDPNLAQPGVCQPGETPLACEYRVVRPAVALIMIGTNDSSAVPLDEYSANLNRIVDISIQMGVIPVLSTIPPRPGFEDAINDMNQIISGTARSRDVPLWDYWSGLVGLPNQGLSADNVHPSWPPGNYSEATNLTAENVTYGYAFRNVTALMVLDAVWRQVLY